MRRKSICEIPDEFIPSSGELVNKIFEFELITPMFGGDADSWKIDTKNPVRSQAVKGMLRFWWRTMQSENDHHKLLYQENKVWGGKTGVSSVDSNRCQSPVKLLIIEQKSNSGEFEGVFNPRNNKFTGVKSDVFPSYVLFPITDKVKGNEQICFIDMLTFKLQISYPQKLENDVLNSLKLWCLFGGIGARTRRGTGSLYCKELLKNFESPEDIKTFVGSFEGDATQLKYPRIIGSTFAAHQENGNNTSKRWHQLLTQFGDYRQRAGVGRGVGAGNRPGRSFWPEPDSIREIAHLHAPTHTPAHPDRNWFPRAAFGLPIQFEFKGEPTDPSGKIMLEPNNCGDRLPSPAILKVIKLPNGKIYRTAFILNQKFLDSLILKGGRINHILSSNEMPSNITGKVMKTNDKLNGKSIYKHLIDFLNLTVV